MPQLVIGQSPPPPAGGCPPALVEAGAQLAGAAALADLLSWQIVTSEARPEVRSIAHAGSARVACLSEAAAALEHAVLEFLGDIVPALIPSAHERLSIARDLVHIHHQDARALAHREAADD
jgi:hypothetical protein